MSDLAVPSNGCAVRLSAVIMTHPSRVDRAAGLRDRHPELDLRVVVDPDPDGPASALRTARVAWAAAGADATHHLVLQDDAVLCPGFADRVVAAVAARPDAALCLFTEWGSATSFAVRLAALAGGAWAEAVDHYTPTVAAVLPAGLARDFADAPAAVPQDDVALRTFLLRRGVDAYLPTPNLVDHDPGISLTGNDFMGERRAACFVETPALDPAVTVRPEALPFFSWIEGRALCNVREDAAGAAWRRELPQWFFARHGIDMAATVAAGRDAVRPLAAGTAISPVLLFGLWVTAFGLGVEAARLVGAERVVSALAGPAAVEALRTMPWGTLRRFAAAADLAAAAPAMQDLLTSGVHRGASLSVGVAS
jgi:hypothetical protein